MKHLTFLQIFVFLMTALLGSSQMQGQTKSKFKTKGKQTVKTEIAVIETKFGSIEIAFFRNDAPKTVENFIQLTKKGYFNGVKIHRVAKGFVIQGGDPTGTGSGGESIYGKKFDDEINKESKLYKDGYLRGIVAMANSGPNTNSSQFFIILKDAPLPPAYTIFGKVTAGMETVDKIAAVDITPQMGPGDGRPKEDITMTKVFMK